MDTSIISFIGGGNMARSLIGGLIADGTDPSTLWVADASQEQLSAVKEHLAVNTTTSNLEAAAKADIVILAVKPQILSTVACELAEVARKHNPLFLSVAAGIREQDLNRWLGGDATIVRAMPNTPALIQSGATALIANNRVTQAQRNQAESIMRSTGLALWLESEAQMDVVTALSGSGPAYYFLIMEALEKAACDLGLAPETARLLTLQTGFGATKMALESSDTLEDLRRRVTSPGGTTEQAIKTLEEGNIRHLLKEALEAAAHRSAELADQFGKDI